MPNTMSISWTEPTDEFAGEIGTAVAVARKRWEELGAHFSELPDEGAGVAYIALGHATVEQVEPAELDFGVLDYDADVSYLLVPGDSPDTEGDVALLLEALLEGELLSVEDLIETANGSSKSEDAEDIAGKETFEQRLEILEALTALQVIQEVHQLRHRDIEPRNILSAPSGLDKLAAADLGRQILKGSHLHSSIIPMLEVKKIRAYGGEGWKVDVGPSEEKAADLLADLALRLGLLEPSHED